MKNNMLIRIALLSCFTSSMVLPGTLLGMGLGDWRYTTEHGNILDDPGGGIRLEMQNGARDDLLGLQRWYFYRDAIIGEYQLWNTPPQFFIAHEQTGVISIFEDRQNWLASINEQGLQPKYWANWHDEHPYYDNVILLNAIVFFPFTFGIVLYLVITLRRAWEEEAFALAGFNTRILLGITTFSICFWQYLHIVQSF